MDSLSTFMMILKHLLFFNILLNPNFRAQLCLFSLLILYLYHNVFSVMQLLEAYSPLVNGRGNTVPYHDSLLLKQSLDTTSIFLKLYKSPLTDSIYRLVSPGVQGKVKAAPEHNFCRQSVFQLNEEGGGARKRWVLHFKLNHRTSIKQINLTETSC